MLGLQQCEPGDSPLELSKEAISESVDRSSRMLEQIFFNGVLSLTDETKL
jgi:hypothetical protein